MHALVINCGSSSLKYRLFDMRSETILARGQVERIGFPGSTLEHRPESAAARRVERPVPNHEVAVEMVIGALRDHAETQLPVDAIGHRVVQGAERFPGPVVLTEAVIRDIEELSGLAPLHNPAAVMGMRACAKVLSGIPGVAVFDTSFHQTIPAPAYLYAIPFDLYKRHKIRRYGFHGTSHKFVAQEAARLLGRPIEGLKLITCHLGNGSSLCAVSGGRSVDTSMGFTPLAGVIMGTRCGDIDPAIVPYLMRRESLSPDDVVDLLNKESGVYGISGLSHDFRDIEAAAARGDERAETALAAFVYSVKKFIGAYVAAMNGVDALVFTGGLGENSEVIRARVCSSLEVFGLRISEELNLSRRWPADISSSDSRTRVLVIPTNEELAIARETVALLV